MVTHPLPSSPFESFIAQMSQLAFFSHGILTFLPALSRTFLWCHKTTSGILNTINHLSLLTQLFVEDIQLPLISLEAEVIQCFATSNLKSGLNGSP